MKYWFEKFIMAVTFICLLLHPFQDSISQSKNSNPVSETKSELGTDLDSKINPELNSEPETNSETNRRPNTEVENTAGRKSNTPLRKNYIKNFQSAKKFLRRIYKQIPNDFYCGCKFEKDLNQMGRYRILSESCGLDSRTGSNRALMVEWEHIVPAHQFGHQRECWTKKDCTHSGKSLRGRKCCSATDPIFSEIEGDLHNLVPAPGEINNDRANFSFGEIPGEKRAYGLCDFEVDFKNKVAEPKESIRGDIARIYFYMEKQWNIPIPKDKRKLYESWHKLDPPDTFEIRKNEIIERIQGRKNPFLP
ncbi:endonuclease [Leptospira sp. 96542]|nr:endonuclease [Leptospira sp. 96542]